MKKMKMKKMKKMMKKKMKKMKKMMKTMKMMKKTTKDEQWTRTREAGCGQTDTCENITFPLRTVTIKSTLQD